MEQLVEAECHSEFMRRSLLNQEDALEMKEETTSSEGVTHWVNAGHTQRVKELQEEM